MMYIVDTDRKIYEQILRSTKRRDVFYSRDMPEQGYALINADNVSTAVPSIPFGIILLSGNAEKLSECYSLYTDNVFCTLDGVLEFINAESVWTHGAFTDMRTRAELILRYIGMNCKLLGFSYLAFLSAYLSFSPNASFKYDIIPRMSEHFGKSAESIERAMRYAVEVTWANGDINAQQAVFGYTVNPEKGKPVTREFAARIAETLKEQSL